MGNDATGACEKNWVKVVSKGFLITLETGSKSNWWVNRTVEQVFVKLGEGCCWLLWCFKNLLSIQLIYDKIIFLFTFRLKYIILTSFSFFFFKK